MCSLYRLPVAKNYNFGQILTFGGPPVSTLFLPVRVKFGVLKQTHGIRFRTKFHVDRFILSSSDGENPQILPFLHSAVCGIAGWQQSEKVEHGSTTTTFAYPTVSKSFLYSNAYMAKSCVRTLTFSLPEPFGVVRR